MILTFVFLVKQEVEILQATYKDLMLKNGKLKKLKVIRNLVKLVISCTKWGRLLHGKVFS